MSQTEIMKVMQKYNDWMSCKQIALEGDLTFGSVYNGLIRMLKYKEVVRIKVPRSDMGFMYLYKINNNTDFNSPLTYLEYLFISFKYCHFIL